MSRPSTTTAALLPALSAALGLPSSLRRLDGASGRGDAGADDTVDGPSRGDTDTAGGRRASTSTTGRRDADGDGPSTAGGGRDLASRARDNASRIYARRVVDRARLEGEHPWADDRRTRKNGGRRRGRPPPGGEGSPSVSAIRSARDRILSEAFVGLVDLGYGRGGSGVGRHLRQAGDRTVLPGLLVPSPAVASCEGTRSLYDRLSRSVDSGDAAAASSDGVDDDAEKPAEWGQGLDLVQRRLDFGREISPLTSTTAAQRVAMAAKRIATLGLLVAPLGVMVPLNVVLGRAAGKPAPEQADGKDGPNGEGERKPSVLQRWHRSATRSTWDYALWAVETAGPTYIKLVQWASTRNDLFSPEFVGHFAKLQDETRGHSWGETERSLVRAYGRDWRDVLSFDSVIDDGVDDGGGSGSGSGNLMREKGGAANRSRQARLGRRETHASLSSSSSTPPTVPIGSGCVAQVYKARLRRSHGLHPAGTSVAVKVQHPNILEKVCLDFYIVNKLAGMLERIPYLNLDYLSVRDSVDQFRDIMLPQLDLRVEAHNLRRFRRDFEGETQIAFPEPMMGLTSREVLVERFVEGEPMLNFVRREDEDHSRADREELARIGLETVMKMIFLHDFVHADLHPVSFCFAMPLLLCLLLFVRVNVRRRKGFLSSESSHRRASSVFPAFRRKNNNTGKHDRRPQQVGARQSHPHNHDRLRPDRRARRARPHEPGQDPRLPHQARRLRRRRPHGRRGQEVPGRRARRRAVLPRHREDMRGRRGQQLPRERGGLHLRHMLPGVQAQGEARGGVHKRRARVRDHGGAGGEPVPQHGGAERGAPDGAEGGDDARAQEPAVAEAVVG